jgi:hypothetical protein
MRWMSYWELACVQRTITVYPVGQKQGFEEIGAQVTLNSPAFPPSRLLSRNDFCLARFSRSIRLSSRRGVTFE